MALRRQSLSPTANLLRNSRLFSLPNPLPKPPVSEAFGAGLTKASDSATLPFPTHQAIATTKRSLARGDWGLKRPLPSRSHLVQVSDPVLRITQLDTIEHVTDFDSAADHVRTRQKWEEMSVPMMKGAGQFREFDLSGASPGGAFEVRDDTTSYDTDLGLNEAGLYFKALKTNLKKRKTPAESFKPFVPPSVDPAVHNTKRWKHEGPWLPGLGADEFTAYLDKEISKRKEEFNHYLVEFVKNEIYATRRLATSQSAQTMPIDLHEAEIWIKEQEKQWGLFTKQEIDAGIRALRKETAKDPLGSKLVTKLILPFLRLPTIKFKNITFAENASRRDINKYQFDQDAAPLSTHPSAGLGYLRTKSYITNHPILGPQANPAPIPARVIQARSTNNSKETYARLGVGGFVANDQFKNDNRSASATMISNARDVETIDIETEGGKKILVQPLFATVTNNGRINIKLRRSSGPEVAVARGELDDRPPVREGYEANPLKGLGSGKSGIQELDEQSVKAKQLSGFLNGMGAPKRDALGDL
ncbi:hypothetical protein IQ07DRAFT_591098 [Pyrenochaeta sp. DS3sAY3a]|nr:hypothetical protein IQ07DRAFT_591098 [Pyrenochaeta sp. DS3sAY3a]